MLWNLHMRMLAGISQQWGILGSMIALRCITHEQMILLTILAGPLLWPQVKTGNALLRNTSPWVDGHMASVLSRVNTTIMLLYTMAPWPVCYLMWIQQSCCFILTRAQKCVCSLMLFVLNVSACQIADGLLKSTGGWSPEDCSSLRLS